MEKAGVSQADIVNWLGKKDPKIEASTVYRWAKGETLPKGDRLAALADYLGVTVDALTGVSEPRDPIKPSRIDSHLLEAGELLRKLARASQPRRALILALIHKKDSYLDALPQETARAVRVLLKVP